MTPPLVTLSYMVFDSSPNLPTPHTTEAIQLGDNILVYLVLSSVSVLPPDKSCFLLRPRGLAELGRRGKLRPLNWLPLSF